MTMTWRFRTRGKCHHNYGKWLNSDSIYRDIRKRLIIQNLGSHYKQNKTENHFYFYMKRSSIFFMRRPKSIKHPVFLRSLVKIVPSQRLITSMWIYVKIHEISRTNVIKHEKVYYRFSLNKNTNIQEHKNRSTKRLYRQLHLNYNNLRSVTSQ